MRFLSSSPIEENYSFFYKGRKIYKTVGYFLADVEGTFYPSIEEIADGLWMTPEAVEAKLTFEEARKVWRKAKELLEKGQ